MELSKAIDHKTAVVLTSLKPQNAISIPRDRGRPIRSAPVLFWWVDNDEVLIQYSRFANEGIVNCSPWDFGPIAQPSFLATMHD